MIRPIRLVTNWAAKAAEVGPKGMLEIHAIERYVIAPVVIFEPGTDPEAEAREFCAWMRKFVSERSRLPKEPQFTFREPEEAAFDTVIADGHADLACAFMKHIVADEEVATHLSQIKLLLEFVDMSEEAADRTANRILNREF